MARRWAVVSLHARALHAVWRQALASPSRTRHSERGNEPLAQRDQSRMTFTNISHHSGTPVHTPGLTGLGLICIEIDCMLHSLRSRCTCGFLMPGAWAPWQAS